MWLLTALLRLLTPWTWFGWKLASKPVSEQVPEKTSANSKPYSAGATENIPGSTVNVAAVSQALPRLLPRPAPATQAHALLHWLQARHAGDTLRSGDVEFIAYPALLREKGWRAQPWDGRQGMGKHLTRLTGGRKQTTYDSGEKRRVRVYVIPFVGNVVALAKRREAS
jgi:hypothetical protein